MDAGSSRTPQRQQQQAPGSTLTVPGIPPTPQPQDNGPNSNSNTNANADQPPQSTPLLRNAIPRVPVPGRDRAVTARSRNSSIRLRRLTNTSQSSDGPTEEDLLALRSLPSPAPARHASVPSRLQSDAAGSSQPRPELRAHRSLHHAPADRNSAPTQPPIRLDNEPHAPVDRRSLPRHEDKHERKERMAVFGRKRIRGEGEASNAPEMSIDNHRRREQRASSTLTGRDYDAYVVDMLDVLDPEVSTMSSITNVQNSLFVPSLGRLVNRRPTFSLTPYPRDADYSHSSLSVAEVESNPMDDAFARHQQDGAGSPDQSETASATGQEPSSPRPRLERIPSILSDSHFAVRPSDLSLATWSDEDLADLNDHVRHMLHSRRSKVGRRFRAFGQYVSRPLGFFVTCYALIIILLGIAWMIFLIGWVDVGSEQDTVIGTTNLTLVTLFTATGIGLIPWRAVDTYHMFHIVRLERLAAKRLKKAGVLTSKRGLRVSAVAPAVRVESSSSNDSGQAPIDIEAAQTPEVEDIASYLTIQQRKSLEHHQACFAESHTFYKPRESETHLAFPVRLLIAIVLLLDGNSAFQLALALCTWTIRYKTRPMALGLTLLCCAMTCNISAAVLISIGDRRTRKKDAVERMLRQELTREAIRRREKKAKADEDKRRIYLDRVREEEAEGAAGGAGRASSQWLRKSMDVVRGREMKFVS